MSTQSNTTVFDFLIYGSLQQRHVSALYVGHRQVVVGLNSLGYTSLRVVVWGRVRDLIMSRGTVVPGVSGWI